MVRIYMILHKQLKVLITILAVTILAVNQFDLVDSVSHEYTEMGMKRALLTFAAARALNGVISVAQGTEVALEPAGIGLTLTPGEILDPMNDLVERFSWVVLVSGTSLGIQELLLNISTWYWFKIIVTMTVLVSLLIMWIYRSEQDPMARFLVRISLVLLVTRFCVPFMAMTNEIIYRNFLEPRYTASSEELRKISFDLDELNQSSQETDTDSEVKNSLFENARRLYRSAAETVNIDARISAFKQAAENIGEHTINLIVVFITQTLLLPLLFLWLFLQLIKWIMRVDIKLE